jgi:hypothetical protein
MSLVQWGIYCISSLHSDTNMYKIIIKQAGKWLQLLEDYNWHPSESDEGSTVLWELNQFHKRTFEWSLC